MFLQLVYVRYAVRTLDTTKKMTKLGKLLSSTLKTDQEWTYMFCLELLHELTNPDCMLTVVQFIMSEMMESLDTQRKEGVELCYTGIKVGHCMLFIIKFDSRSGNNISSLTIN